MQQFTPLPADFLAALAEHEEVLVTSRDGRIRGTVPVWYVIAPPGVVYLFSEGFSQKVRRWRRDPWIRLTIPGTQKSVEGTAHFAHADDNDVAPMVVERWSMRGAPTLEGLRRSVRDGMYVLIRVEGAA